MQSAPFWLIGGVLSTAEPSEGPSPLRRSRPAPMVDSGSPINNGQRSSKPAQPPREPDMPPPLSVSKLVLAFVAASALVAAQPGPDEDHRRSLIADAEAARDAGLHDRAVSLATQAGQIRWTPSLRMLVAEEHLALQHGVDALDHATHCLVGAEADPSVRNRARIVSACRAIIDLLQPQVGRLRLVLPDSPPPGLRLRINGRELPRSAWSAAFRVMSGTALIEADGEGVTAFRTTTTVFGGAERELRLRFTEPPPPPPPPPRVVSPPTDRPSSPR